jgi:hypothetical protein
MIRLRQGCKKIPLSLVTQVKRFLWSLRDEANGKMECTCPEQDNKENMAAFKYKNMMLVLLKTMNLQKIG